MKKFFYIILFIPSVSIGLPLLIGQTVGKTLDALCETFFTLRLRYEWYAMDYPRESDVHDGTDNPFKVSIASYWKGLWK